MIIGSVLVGLAALVLVAGLICWSAGVQLAALVKILLGGSALLLALAGGAVVTTDLLTSAGYLDYGRGEPKQQAEVQQTVQPMPTSEALTETETAGLPWMHRNAVEIFVASPGFGMRRMILPLEDIVTASKSQQEEATVQKTAFRGFVNVEAEKPGERVHFAVQEKMLQWSVVVATAPNAESKEVWKIRKVHLAGLVKQPFPVVYLTDKFPVMADKIAEKDVPMRELDAFEKSALQAIQHGDNLKTEKHGKEMRVVGPIYAGQSCLKCHEQKGQLLGLFTYQLEKVPGEPVAVP